MHKLEFLIMYTIGFSVAYAAVFALAWGEITRLADEQKKMYETLKTHIRNSGGWE